MRCLKTMCECNCYIQISGVEWVHESFSCAIAGKLICKREKTCINNVLSLTRSPSCVLLLLLTSACFLLRGLLTAHFALRCLLGCACFAVLALPEDLGGGLTGKQAEARWGLLVARTEGLRNSSTTFGQTPTVTGSQFTTTPRAGAWDQISGRRNVRSFSRGTWRTWSTAKICKMWGTLCIIHKVLMYNA